VSATSVSNPVSISNGETLLELRGLTKTFHSRRRHAVTALSEVSFRVPRGKVTALVGESGSGKSTTIRCILGLEKPDSGWIEYKGQRLSATNGSLGRARHREIQVVFQDPTASLNPRMSAADLISEGLIVHGLAKGKAAQAARCAELMRLVGLDPDSGRRRPRDFSGGQRQRIAIARALAVEPELLICDEAVSALDVSVQAQILNLLLDMRDRLDLTVLFVAHDLAVVRQIAAEIVVLRHGQVVEEGPADTIFTRPEHPYTRELLQAVPIPDPPRARARAAQNRSRSAAPA
jgi:peptide/nickel transport system ATP-binding protein/oligopeptide transport system ATP-binding protein